MTRPDVIVKSKSVKAHKCLRAQYSRHSEALVKVVHAVVRSCDAQQRRGTLNIPVVRHATTSTTIMAAAEEEASLKLEAKLENQIKWSILFNIMQLKKYLTYSEILEKSEQEFHCWEKLFLRIFLGNRDFHRGIAPRSFVKSGIEANELSLRYLMVVFLFPPTAYTSLGQVAWPIS